MIPIEKSDLSLGSMLKPVTTIGVNGLSVGRFSVKLSLSQELLITPHPC